jgi:hypothetical protein
MNTALYPRKELTQVNSQKSRLGRIFYVIILNTGSALLKEKKYNYANSTTQRCPKEIKKTFLTEDFFHLALVSMTPVVHLELQIYPQICEKN